MIVAYPDPRLTRKAEPRPLDDSLRAIGNRLLEATRAANAYGLAAVHIGAVAPVVVISADEDAVHACTRWHNRSGAWPRFG